MYSGLALLMDVYYPENPNGYGIIHISGSSWTRSLSYDTRMLNHTRHVKLEGEIFVEAGYTLFSINHRAAPRFVYPAAVEDAQRAVRFIRYHADQYGINPDKIGVIGGSSGGHLACMLGVLDGSEKLMDETPINKISAKVQCVIARAAPTDLLNNNIGTPLLGFKVRENPATSEYKLAREASPIYHVSEDDPPFLLIHGDLDKVVPIELSQNMFNKLKEMNVVVKLLPVKGGHHGPGLIDSPEIKEIMVQWMDMHLIEK